MIGHHVGIAAEYSEANRNPMNECFSLMTHLALAIDSRWVS